MMEESKRISIVMCTYNGEKFLREQLDSIVAQTYPIFELLIQDDGSTDSTIEIISEYAARYPYISWCVNECNLGYNANFRTAIQRAKGELIAISDQDDIWYANKLEELVKCIGECSMSYAYSTIPGKTDAKDIKQALNHNNTPERLLFANVIPGHAMLLRKTFIDQLPFWDDHIFYDWWLAINAYLQHGVCQCEQVLTDHRVHTESVMAGFYKTKDKKHLPYIKGYQHYKRLQTLPTWQLFYQHIYDESKNKQELAVVHHITKVMLKKDLFAFISLCFLSMKHRETLMPRLTINRFRSFFYPCFSAYKNHLFDSNK